MNARVKTGILLALSTALISGVANFVNKVSVTVMKDAVLYTTLKNSMVALALLGVIVVLPHLRRKIPALTRREWVKLIAIGCVGGSVPFALFFIGLQKMSALNASLIHKTLFLWVALLAVPLLKERIGWLQGAALVLFAAGNVLVGGFQGFKYNAGEAMVLGATLFWAVEQIIAKKMLTTVPPAVVAGARMIFGSMILAAFVMLRGGSGAVFTLSATQWLWTLLPSALLLGYVLTWYSTLSRLPAVAAASLLVPATLVTNILSAAFVTRTLPPLQAYSAVVMVGAIALVVAAAFHRFAAPSTPITTTTL